MATIHVSRIRKEYSADSVKAALERDILTLLRHMTNKPLTFKGIRRELLTIYSERQIQEAVLSLVERDLIETVYPCGFELGFKVSERKSNHR